MPSSLRQLTEGVLWPEISEFKLVPAWARVPWSIDQVVTVIFFTEQDFSLMALKDGSRGHLPEKSTSAVHVKQTVSGNLLDTQILEWLTCMRRIYCNYEAVFGVDSNIATLGIIGGVTLASERKSVGGANKNKSSRSEGDDAHNEELDKYVLEAMVASGLEIKRSRWVGWVDGMDVGVAKSCQGLDRNATVQ
ncbi:hypothetical protein BS50DRAFT_653794 [Corynespora cassiicola Philippines]|uniref:Uncharacterized protein n=1 Tax=Corynespora cassiicola Philippines TaxID=1448308 RepID=A0A2T2P7K5_CORCC|nr:hypothetical protein BS50DRAFT_653794 [Corynespora cassiicola Philippines]